MIKTLGLSYELFYAEHRLSKAPDYEDDRIETATYDEYEVYHTE